MKVFLKKYVLGRCYNGARFIFQNFWKISWLKTISVNLVALPFTQAIKIPILVGKNVQIKNIGNVDFTCTVLTGLFSIGVERNVPWDGGSEWAVFSNHGTIRIGGEVWLHPGCKLYVKENAQLSFGDKVKLGYMCRIICYKKIDLGGNVRISWESQIFDTDFHFLKNLENGKIYRRIKPVLIYNDVFIGNRVTIGKGTILTKGSVVSCCSKINKDYTSYGDNLLITGNSAEVVKKGVEMSSSWEILEEVRLESLIDEK